MPRYRFSFSLLVREPSADPQRFCGKVKYDPWTLRTPHHPVPNMLGCSPCVNMASVLGSSCTSGKGGDIKNANVVLFQLRPLGQNMLMSSKS